MTTGFNGNTPCCSNSLLLNAPPFLCGARLPLSCAGILSLVRASVSQHTNPSWNLLLLPLRTAFLPKALSIFRNDRTVSSITPTQTCYSSSLCLIDETAVLLADSHAGPPPHPLAKLQGPLSGSTCLWFCFSS